MQHATPAALDARAIIEASLGHEAEAEAAYRAALAAETAPMLWRYRANTLDNFAILQLRRGAVAQSRALALESAQIALAHHALVDASSAYTQLAEIASYQKDGAEALRAAGEALRLGREAQHPQVVANALVARGHVLETAGQDAEAGQSYAEALTAAESIRADAPALGATLDSELLEWMPAYQAAVRHELRLGHALEALRLADRAKARVLLDMIGRGQPALDAAANPADRAEAQKIGESVARARRDAIVHPQGATQSALEAALRRQDDFNLRFYGLHPELALQRAAPPDIQPQQLASLATGRTALLSYFVLPDSVALFVVLPGGPGAPRVRAFTLPPAAKLAPQIRALRNQIAARDLDYRSAARALFDALLGPAAAVLAGSTRWLVSPDGALWDVPFQALLDPSGRHLLETHALSYAPSLATLCQLRARPPTAGRLKLLAIGNPRVTGVAEATGTADESAAIAALYGPRSLLLTGARATAAQFRANAAAAEVIHVASHAETETNHPLESFLLLAPPAQPAAGEDGALTARDLLSLPLGARLVVLSACETARGKVAQGEGVLGLAWAVLAAGARASVVSQWKVDSAATGSLMVDFHRRLTANHPPDTAEALRQAALGLLHTPGRQHPFYWASFILLGDSR